MLGLALCATTTAGCSDDPFDFGGPRSCEPADQNAWVYGLMQQAYLFADELPEVDPLAYDEPSELMGELRVAPDRWSRISDKSRTEALYQKGKNVSLGFRTRRDAQGRVVVATVDEGSPAATAGLVRGNVLRSVGGWRTQQLDDEGLWSEAYGESEPGVVVELEVEAQDGSVRVVSLVKDWASIVTVPVQRIHEVDGRPVGYLVLSTFVETSIDALTDAFDAFRRAGVREVVVDLRYNGGGLIRAARHFMHLLVGGIADGRTAYAVRYNEGFSDENEAHELMRLPQSLSAVDHVVFITTGTTLSASELLINAVAAHVPVSLVGETTGGKPVGSKHFPFCDKVAVPLTFRLVNADGRGDYFDGLPPTCAAPDDLTRQLGDAHEGSLATALHLLGTGRCLPHEGEGEGEGEGASAGDPAGLRPAPAAPASRRDAILPSEWPELGGLR